MLFTIFIATLRHPPEEKYPQRDRRINLHKKSLGKRSALNAHAAFDVAGGGNIDSSLMRHCSTLPVGERGGNEPLYPELLGGRF
jgi:hypothetical protein